MKNLIIIISLFLISIIIGIFSIQIGKNDNDKIINKKTHVTFLMNGSSYDRGWGASHRKSMDIVANNLNLDVEYIENAPFDKNLTDLLELKIQKNNPKVIVANSIAFSEKIKEISAHHPGICFLQAAGVQTSSNLSSYFGRMYQMRYLSGIVAGLQTISNKIGYVAAFPISEVNRGINAFTLGVKKVNPNATVYVVWTNSWESAKDTVESTNHLLEKQPAIDVLTMHVDNNKVLDIAEERKIWSIGYHLDNYENYKNSFLTAPIWHWENYLEEKIFDCLNGKFEGDIYWKGASSGIVDIAPLSPIVKKETIKIIQDIKQQFLDEYFDVFNGPIVDRNGVLRVNIDETIPDNELLNNMNWYVDGVETIN
ncbi:MAG: BMP family ABC transporter substrate-binding protein [Succinivibrionaceae bacterium]